MFMNHKLNELKKHWVDPKEAVKLANNYRKFEKFSKNIKIKAKSEICDSYIIFSLDGKVIEINWKFEDYDLIYVLNKWKVKCWTLYTDKFQEIMWYKFFDFVGTG